MNIENRMIVKLEKNRKNVATKKTPRDSDEKNEKQMPGKNKNSACVKNSKKSRSKKTPHCSSIDECTPNGLHRQTPGS